MAATEQAKAALRHRDTVGQVQEGRSGLGLGTSTPAWNKANPSQRHKLVVQEVCREEEAVSGTGGFQTGRNRTKETENSGPETKQTETVAFINTVEKKVPV